MTWFREDSRTLSQHKFRYGYRKITRLLEDATNDQSQAGTTNDATRTAAMPCQGQETKSNGTACLCSRALLKREFQADTPMQKLVTDITYLPLWRENDVSVEYIRFV